MTFHPCPKPRPALLDKRQKRREWDRIGSVEDRKVKKRSHGCCEVIERYAARPGRGLEPRWNRIICTKRGAHIHHLMYGIGVRNVGDSIRAEHKLHVCTEHHTEIHGHVLQAVGPGRFDAATVVYERRD